MALGHRCSQQGSLIGRPVAWSPMCVCVAVTVRSLGDPCQDCFTSAYAAGPTGLRRVRSTPGSLSLDWRGEGMGGLRGQSPTPSPPLPPTSSGICLLSEAGLGLRATKAASLQATATCWVFTLGGEVEEGAVALSPVSAVCPLCSPPGPGILFAAQCDRAQEPVGVGGPQQLEGN